MEDMKNNGSFEEKQAVEYIEQHGIDGAISKLSSVSKKSPEAKKILGIVLDLERSQHEKTSRLDHACNDKVSLVSPCKPVRNEKVRRKLSPKAMGLAKIDLLGLSPDVELDRNFNPVVEISWKKGRAVFMDRNVCVIDAMEKFMERQVNRQEEVSFKASVHTVKDKEIVVSPHIDDYFKAVRAKQSGREITVEVQGSGDGVFVNGSDDGKFVCIPVKYHQQLLENPGLWTFTTVREFEKRTIVRPVKHVAAQKPKVIRGIVSDNDGFMHVMPLGLRKKVTLPRNAVEKLKSGSTGMWLFNILKETDDRLVLEPVEYLFDQTREEYLSKKNHPSGVFELSALVENRGHGFSKVYERHLGKKVFIPDGFLRVVLNKDGMWAFRVLKETVDAFIVEPVEQQILTLNARIEDRGHGLSKVYEWHEGKKVFIPSRFLEKVHGMEGIWSFKVLDVNDEAFIVEPLERTSMTVKTSSGKHSSSQDPDMNCVRQSGGPGDRDPWNNRPMPQMQNVAQPVQMIPTQVPEDVADSRLDQLKSNGAISF